MQRFLSYIVGETLAGRSVFLKEYTIGVNVFEKTDDFDPRVCPIVRVEAGRLRRLLAQYKIENNRRDQGIEIPKGSYVPVIRLRSVLNAPSGLSETAPSAIVSSSDSLSHGNDYLMGEAAAQTLAAASLLRDRYLTRTADARATSKRAGHKDAKREAAAALALQEMAVLLSEIINNAVEVRVARWQASTQHAHA